MIVVGLTGGIGSGKTTVAKLFEQLGVPIYIADIEAKRLMSTSKVIRRKLIALFGDSAYVNDELNRKYVASKIFNDATLLAKMNSIVHPKVGKDFKRWLKKQSSVFVIKEAAIIFEHQMESDYDYVITVTANIEDKIERILKRDNTTRERVLDIIKNQMSDEEKISKSDFVIINNELENTGRQVLETYRKILQNIA
jgi:dephospho-CoA kinase